MPSCAASPPRAFVDSFVDSCVVVVVQSACLDLLEPSTMRTGTERAVIEDMHASCGGICYQPHNAALTSACPACMHVCAILQRSWKRLPAKMVVAAGGQAATAVVDVNLQFVQPSVVDSSVGVSMYLISL